jgi:hypothetical protein
MPYRAVGVPDRPHGRTDCRAHENVRRPSAVPPAAVVALASPAPTTPPQSTEMAAPTATERRSEARSWISVPSTSATSSSVGITTSSTKREFHPR